MDFYPIIAPLLRLLSPEDAHDVALQVLRRGLLPAAPARDYPSLQLHCFGLNFKNPVGLAAGFDKNAEVVDAALAHGFGFVEAGTVTPKPQPGNPKPRIFRLLEDRAVINRLGFNGKGVDQFVRNIQLHKKSGIVGANLGKNKDSTDAVIDYLTLLSAVYPHADYITINISSPNTPGLRDLQHKASLEQLLGAMVDERAKLMKTHQRYLPILLKIAPDLSDAEKEDIAEVVLGKAIDGMIVSNTTIRRPESLQSKHRAEQGGLSGEPLFDPSTQMLRDIYRLTRGQLPLIGVGGIGSGEQAYRKILAGASLVQLYSALTYQGFSLVRRINETLAALLERDGFKSISEAVGKEQR